MDANGPAQPTVDQAYVTPGNPVDQTPSETNAAQKQSPLNSTTTSHRTPNDQSNATATTSPLGAGSGAKADRGERQVGEADDLDGEQMRAPGEGEVMAAQWNKTGMGEQKSLTSDLDRMKAEQSGQRSEVQQSRREDVDVDGALGQTGGPATVEGR